ncbi:MAG: DUF2934 domain-containing protein [Methylophilaceae bacterium]
MAVSPTKKTTPKKPVKKTASPKKPAAKKSAVKKARKISAVERYKMIEIAAYYIAEQNNFQGNAIDFWIAAEEEVSKKIG